MCLWTDFYITVTATQQNLSYAASCKYCCCYYYYWPSNHSSCSSSIIFFQNVPHNPFASLREGVVMGCKLILTTTICKPNTSCYDTPHKVSYLQLRAYSCVKHFWTAAKAVFWKKGFLSESVHTHSSPCLASALFLHLLLIHFTYLWQYGCGGEMQDWRAYSNYANANSIFLLTVCREEKRSVITLICAHGSSSELSLCVLCNGDDEMLKASSQRTF